MKRVSIAVLALLLSFGLPADEKEAMALAESGVTLIGAGKVEKGKDMLFKALAHDANCPIALFELGKLFEASGMNVSAADFLARASVEFAKAEKSNPAYAGKRTDANRRLQKLNPYANQFTTIMEDYAAELGKIAKKSPDSMTAEEAIRRMNTVSLSSLIAADKMPKIDPPKSAAKPEEEEPRGKLVRTGNGWKIEPKEPAKTEVPPDVERALKADGWATITGVWKKLDGNKYEVTDGKLESPKLNGAIQVFVHKGSAGTVKAFVRTAKSDGFDDDFDFKWNARGYGVIIKGLNAKIYSPTQWMGGTYSPYLDHEVALPDANPKHQILVSIQEKTLDITLNGKREKKADYPIAKEGTFMIQVDGTAIIEAPKAGGQ